ncbi:MAG: hypothetical protein IT548_18595 [Alphaproteobacteria bacterium]|nr:hypothetical protein [Alphaproteobacteria bacterium]
MSNLIDDPILASFDGRYNAAFVALHPFCFVPGIRPSDFRPMTTAVAVSPGDELEPEDMIARLKQGDPSKFSTTALLELEKRVGVTVRWSAVIDELGLHDHRALDRVLRTSILGIREHLMDREGELRLNTLVEARGLIQPSEGRIQARMERPLGEMFRRAGLEHVLLQDEFGDFSVHLDVERLLADECVTCSNDIMGAPPLWANLDGHVTGFSPQCITSTCGGIRAVVEWDSFFTVLFGQHNELVRLDIPSLFEGFWCEPATEIFWLQQPVIDLANR